MTMGLVPFICLLAATLVSGADEEDLYVLTLTENNFDEIIGSSKHVLVDFYAPWCGHCKKLEPEYSAAAVELKDEDVSLTKVDATVDKQLGTKFSIEGYPTLLFFVEGKKQEYTGGRTTSDIVSWVRKKIGPSVSMVKDLAEFKASAEVVVVAFLGGESDPLYGVMEQVARHTETPVGLCSDATVASSAGVSQPSVVLYKQFDEGEAVLDTSHSGISEAALEEFIKLHSLPLVVPFIAANQKKIFDSDLAHQVILMHGEANEEALDIFSKVAKSLKGRAVFVTIQADANEGVLKFFDVSKEQLPQVVVFNKKSNKKFPFKGDLLQEEQLSSFAADAMEGVISPTLKTQEPPTDNSSPLLTLVGTNFESVANNAETDVLVQFYAPWCGHCKKLAPIYEEVAEHYANEDSIVVAQMDATANELESPEVAGFPTIFLFPADNKDGVKFAGARTKEGLIDFVESYRTTTKVPGEQTKDEL